MSEDIMLHEAVEALSLGQRTRAKDLLTRLLRADQDNANYWIWMSAAVDSTSERIYCLETAQRLDPYNSTAIRGLVLLGAKPAEEDIQPAPIIRRKWGTTYETPEPPKNLFIRVYENPFLRFLAIGGVVVLLVSLVLLGVYGIRPLIQDEPMLIVRVSITPEDSSLYTPTPVIPTRTPLLRSPTPTFLGPTPLKLMLSATYTPAPLYVNTPHPISEAYSAALRAFYRDDYPVMLDYMRQAAQNNPQAPDTHYYVGEAHRLLGEYEEALEAYNQSILVDPQFAPAYVGRARVQLLIDPKANPDKDLEQAIELDPNLVDTYIVRAGYLLAKDNAPEALEDLAVAEALNPDLPILYVYRAQARLVLGEKESALADAQHAHALDFTSLPAYLVLGYARLANQLPKEALESLKIYLVFQEEDPGAWLAVGQAYYAIGEDYTKAIDAFDQALALDPDLPGVYYHRGLTYIAMEEGQKAVNDLGQALRLDPYSFEINIEFGHALLLAGRVNDAYGQINSSKNLAERDDQLAVLYYWRALAQEALGNPANAIQDWQALLDLPEDAVQESMRIQAQQHLRVLTATATPTITSTPSPTLTPTFTLTPSPTRTPTLTLTPSPTRTPTSTLTPSPTHTPTSTPTPSPTRTPRPTRTPSPTR